MIVLSLDTSSRATSCALVLLDDGGGVRLLAEALYLPPARAGDLLPAALAAVCAGADKTLGDVSGFAVGIGPGSFTGLRVGIASAKGLCYARRWPLVGASTLEALAVAAWDGNPHGTVLVPALEARRGELFVAAFAPRRGKPAARRAVAADTDADADADADADTDADTDTDAEGRALPALIRLREDAVVSAAGLAAWLRTLPGAPLVVGPGARQNRAALLAGGVPAESLQPEGDGADAAWPSALAVAMLAAPALRGASFDPKALFALAPDYLTPSEPEKALAEGRVGKLPGAQPR